MPFISLLGLALADTSSHLVSLSYICDSFAVFWKGIFWTPTLVQNIPQIQTLLNGCFSHWSQKNACFWCFCLCTWSSIFAPSLKNLGAQWPLISRGKEEWALFCFQKSDFQMVKLQLSPKYCLLVLWAGSPLSAKCSYPQGPWACHSPSPVRQAKDALSLELYWNQPLCILTLPPPWEAV
jgi:hypothetical protein